MPTLTDHYLTRARAVECISALDTATRGRSPSAEERSARSSMQAALDGAEAEIRGAGMPSTSVISTRTEYAAPGDGPEVLRRDQSFAEWARRTGQIPADHLSGRPLNLGIYLRGMTTGDWPAGSDLERRVMGEGTLTAGGYAVPTVLSASIIELARNQARVLQAGATVVPMSTQTVNLAKWAGDPAVAWHSENALITASDATLARVQLVAKSLSSLVVVSRELLEDAEPGSVDVELRQAFAAQFALTLDSAALYGTGVAPSPQGIKSASGVSVTPLGANGAALTNWDPVVNAIYALRAANENPSGVIYSPRTEKNFALLKDTTNQPLSPPTYMDGIARYATAQIGNAFTVGTGTTTSDMFVADWSQLLVGIRTSLTIQPLIERYADFGQVGFVAWFRGDVAVARPAAFNVTTGIL